MSEDDISSTRSWSELPVSVLTFAFEKLDLRDRAGTVNCVALFCTSWAAAAAAATTSIELSRCLNTDSLQQWLRSRGSHVIKVNLRGSKGVITSLPCPRLKWLVLEDVSVDLLLGSQLLQDLSAATTTLEHLHLYKVKFQRGPDPRALLQRLLSFRARNNVYLGYTTALDSRNQQQQQPHASTATAVHCTNRISQDVSCSLFWSNPGGSQLICITDEGMQFVCKLTKLQSLELHNMVMVTAAGLSGLHNLPALKCLVLEDLCCEISASAVPALTQLTALTYLKLGWTSNYHPGDFDPAVLAHMMQLEELHLRRPMLPRGASRAAELLARLAQLTKLQVLSLADVDGLPQCPPAALSSLTSISMLRSLTWRNYGDQPGAPWQHLFPGRLHLSALTQLETAHAACWEAPDLDRLVSSCSHVQKLSLCCSPGLQLTALTQLADLVQLWLQGRTDKSTMATLAQLSGLHRLQRLAVTDPGGKCRSILFMPLTALTQLTYLALPHYSELRHSMQQRYLQLRGRPLAGYIDWFQWPSASCSVITSTAPAGASPDVWFQLLSCCEGGAAAAQQHTAAPQQQHQEEGPLAGPV